MCYLAQNYRVKEKGNKVKKKKTNSEKIELTVSGMFELNKWYNNNIILTKNEMQ